MSPRPTNPRLVVVCRVSTRCNLSCGFCAYDRRLRFARLTLSEARIEHLISLMSARRRAPGETPALLSWLGGEPLLWPRWGHFSALARAGGIAVSATTNGSTLWRPQTRAAVLEHLSELTVSVDAIGEQHDRLRGWRGGYARTLAALQALARDRGKGPGRTRLRANTVLMRSTIGQFADLCAALAQAGVDEISFNLLGGRDRPEFHAAEAVSAAAFAEFAKQLPRMREALARSGVGLSGDAAYLRRLGAAAQGEPWPVADCAPGTQFLFVDEHGVVAPCAFTSSDYGLPLDQISDLSELPGRFRIGRQVRCAQACGDCPSTQVFGKFDQPAHAGSSAAHVVDLQRLHTDTRVRDFA
jgi:MoaA/NifB/PqqE/SkfB family radical SAM enzyme